MLIVDKSTGIEPMVGLAVFKKLRILKKYVFCICAQKDGFKRGKNQKVILKRQKIEKAWRGCMSFFFSSIMCHTHFLLFHFQQQQKNDKNDERFSFLNNGCCDK